MVKFLCKYGPFKKDTEAVPNDVGYDFYIIKHKGHRYHVPKCVVTHLQTGVN